MVYLWTFIIIFNSTLFLSEKNNRKITENLISIISIIILILFLGGLFHILNITFIFLLVISIIIFGYNLFNYKNIIKKRENIFNFEFLIFIILFILFSIGTEGRFLCNWDEFSHWGLSIKNMFYFDQFYSSNNMTTLFKDYPPVIALFQYFILKLNGNFNESLLYFSNQLLILSIVVRFYKIFENTTKLNKIIATILILFVPTIFYRDVYVNLQVDAIIGILFFNVIYQYFSESKINVTELSLSLFLLVLIKDIGLLFAGFAFLLIFIDQIFIKGKKESIKQYNKIFILFSTIVLSYILWKLNLYINNIHSTWSNPINIKETIKSLLLIGDGYQVIVVKNFIFSVFKNSVSTMIQITIFNMFLFLILWILFIRNKLSGKEKKLRFTLFSIMFLFVGILYLLILLILYITKFSEYEAVRLASFSRYINTYFVSAIFIYLFITLKLLLEGKKSISIELMVIFVVSFYIFDIGPLLSLTGRFEFSKNYTIEKRNEYNFYEKFVKNITFNEKVYVISQNSTGEDSYIIRYLSSPKGINSGNWSIGNPYYEGDIWTKNISLETWETDLLENYSYVYIHKYDEQFRNLYGSFFSSDLSNKTFYKVEKLENGKIMLEAKIEDNN